MSKGGKKFFINPQTYIFASGLVILWLILQDGSQNDRQVNNSDDAALANQKRMNADPLEVMLMNMGYRISGFHDVDEEEGNQGDGPANCRTA